MEVRIIRAEMPMGRSIFDLPLRVTVYARVSADQEEQINSSGNQVQYYTELILSKKNWTFVTGYIDEGISGISTRHRDDFNRMIRDAKAGSFDFIITKGISRFFRSTLDSIKYTQELPDYNVGVFFQNDNINTLDTDGSCMSFLFAVGYFICKLLNWNTFRAGIAPLVIGMFLLGGIQLIFIDIMGKHILCINERIKTVLWWWMKND